MNVEQLKSKMNTYLCPPGNGVYTVNTAKERKELLHNKLYGSTDNVENDWKKSIESNLENSEVCMLGVCSDTGGGILRGANWGPLFVRQTLLQEHPNLNIFDMGDIRVIPHILHDKYLNDQTIENCRGALYNDKKSELPVSALSITEDFTRDFHKTFPNKKIFSIGGDHSVSYPLTKTYLQAKKAEGKRVSIIHFDAHTDLLVERLGIDICFGSWATHIIPFLNSPDHLIQIGIRSSGKPKEHWETKFGVKQYWSQEVIERGPSDIVEEIIAHLEKEKIEELYVSFDIDALDSEYASATGTPEPGGLSPHEPMVILQALAQRFKITGADMVEIAPFLNTNNLETPEPQTTLTVGAAISAFLIEAMNNGDS